MKVLQIVGNARYGGATYLMLEWSKYLLEKNCQVAVLCTDERMIQEVKRIPEIRLIDSVFIPREIQPLTDLRAFGQLMTLFRSEGYDLVHTYTATPSFLGRLAARLMRVPIIVNHQGGWAVNEESNFLDRLIFTPLEYLATLACNKNICVGHAEAQKAQDLHLAPAHKLVTIINGIDGQPFAEASARRSKKDFCQTLGIREDHLLIGNTGRLVSGKGNAYLIEALAQLRTISPDLKFSLLLAGDGVDRDELMALIGRLGLNRVVHLLGFYEDIPRLLANIDIFVTPTLSEGLSLALLEAMAAARPIIATDIPANAEVIEHERSGLLVPVRSPTQIAQAVARFVLNPDLAQSCAAAAQKRVLEYYSLDRMFQETWDLYTNLWQEKAPTKKRVWAELYISQNIEVIRLPLAITSSHSSNSDLTPALSQAEMSNPPADERYMNAIPVTSAQIQLRQNHSVINQANVRPLQALLPYLESLNKGLNTDDTQLIEGPPVLESADSAILASRVSGIILLFETNKTTIAMARQAIQILQDAGGRLIGVVLID